MSSITTPLTALLTKGPKGKKWKPMADKAFDKIKVAFTLAFILKHPDPSKSFIVEVDDLESGVGAVLFQCVGDETQTTHFGLLLKKTFTLGTEL